MKFLWTIFIFYLAFSQSQAQIEIDTIIERNNPQYLDLEKHQLFIDTTQSSFFQKALKSKKKSRKGFQTFQVVRKLKNEFVLYKRSDGNDPLIEFNKDSLIFYGIHETTSYKVKDIQRKEYDINLTIQEKNRSFKKVKIEPTKGKNIFIITFYGKRKLMKHWIIPIEEKDQLHILVNSYRYSKISEFDEFTEP